MAQTYSQRAPFNDWWYWSECLGRHYHTIATLYRENGEPDRGTDLVAQAKRLKDNCMKPVMAARDGMKTDEQKAAIKQMEEDAILEAVVMLRDGLANLPFMSSSIQDFLGVDWRDFAWPDETKQEEEEIDEQTGLPKKKKKKRKETSDTRLISLFAGPKGRDVEALRSGEVVDGGFAGTLYNLLLAERTSTNRAPTDYGAVMQSAAAQQYIATSQQKWEKAGVTMNLKPGGSM